MPRPRRAAHAEHVFEDVGEGRAEIGAEAVRAAHAAALLERGMAEAVVGGALVGVLEDVVGLVDFLELVLAVLVAGIAVRVTLHRELAIGRLELGVARGALDRQDFVVAALGHHSPPDDANLARHPGQPTRGRPNPSAF